MAANSPLEVTVGQCVEEKEFTRGKSQLIDGSLQLSDPKALSAYNRKGSSLSHSAHLTIPKLKSRSQFRWMFDL